MTTQAPKNPNYRDIEKAYQKILSLATKLDEHPWSRSIIDRDAEVIRQVKVSMLRVADDLFLATHETGEQS